MGNVKHHQCIRPAWTANEGNPEKPDGNSQVVPPIPKVGTESYLPQRQKIGQDGRYFLEPMSSDFEIEATIEINFKTANIMGGVWAFGKDLSEIGRFR